MIDQLRLTNFKCFSEDKINFRNLTILSGANAAGKSSVIQALLLIWHTNELMHNKGENWDKESIDINQVFGFQIGAPNSLICQNPTEDENFDFALELRERGVTYGFQYVIDKVSPLDLKVKAGKAFPGIAVQYLNAERIGPRMANQAGQKNGIVLNGENAAYLMDVADKSGRYAAGFPYRL